MTTLTEFLLARIAEDEAGPWRHFQVDDIYYSCPATRDPEWAGDLDVGEEYCDCGMPARRVRMLAECEAKRRIVNLGDDGTFSETPSGTIAWVVMELATVYADHSDYDETWRP